MAVAAFAPHPGMHISSRFASLALPTLTEEFVSALIETHLDISEQVTGGFDCAQRGNCHALLQNWPGATFREQAEALHVACLSKGHTGTLDLAAQFVLSVPELALLVDHTLATMSERSRSLLASTLNHAVLQRELQRCQSALREAALEPLVVWLHEAGMRSLTLVPCGSLAAFPLVGTLLGDGRTLGETLPTSIAPGARALLHEERTISPRTGIYALGNPYPTQQNLRWGEAEAFALAELGNSLQQSASVKVQWQATRDWLVEALQTGLVVNASCHGIFDSHNFMRSRLILAHEEELTLSDMLSYQADLRGLRLLILSACQTAMLDLQGARDEVRSLAAGMLQAGAAAILASLWAVDDRATYLLMVRFALEWFPQMNDEPPATVLANAQYWLRTVTNRELQAWQANISPLPVSVNDLAKGSETVVGEHVQVKTGQLVAVRGRANRFDAAQAQDSIQADAEELAPDACPYADPYYWAGFQITGW
jgi:CHAT domain-containing protein